VSIGEVVPAEVVMPTREVVLAGEVMPTGEVMSTGEVVSAEDAEEIEEIQNPRVLALKVGLKRSSFDALNEDRDTSPKHSRL
jgi:hypothetical protein